MNDNRNTLKSAIYGLAVGDALGVPYEFKFRGAFECKDMTGYGTHNQPEGTWSDDTSMALATCASIKACGRVDVDDIRDRFRRWLKEGAYSCKWCVTCRGNNGTCTGRFKAIGSNVVSPYDGQL